MLVDSNKENTLTSRIYFQKSELRLIVGDDIKISVGEKNMLVLEDYNQKIKNKIVIRKDQII